ncbi:MAG: hypothetical protein M3361_19895, partial [Candidatus Tectomicrobia bacterium]|nr:hypothetical protein [Candidatus Tectomicrobia bacterium]
SLLGLKLEKLLLGASSRNFAVKASLGEVRKTILSQHADYRGFFQQALLLIFGKVDSPKAFKTPLRAGEAACGTA